MTATTIRVQMAQRKDTAANWTAANPILLSGEIGYETDTKKFKIGNGSTAWNSLAYLPIPDGSGNLTITGNLEIGSTGSLTFEGSTADGFETTLAVTNPTADRTITLPDVTGTVVTTGDTGSVTSTMIANGTIVDADISSTAEIAVSKLANGTANQVIVTDGTNVSWSDNLTLAGDLTVNGTTTTINTQDLLVEDKNIIIGNVATPSDVTADGGGITLKGATDKTINWVDATDAWTLSEHVNIASGKEYRIAGTKVLDATSLGSSVLITSANITDGTIVDGDISATAEIAVSKLADGAARQLLQTDAAGTGVEWASNIDIPGTLDVTGAATFDSSVAVTGTLTKSGNNVVTVGDTGTVTSTMILDGTIVDGDVNATAAIAGTKISPNFGSQNVTTTGTSTAASFIPTSSTAPTNGLYLSGTNTVGISTGGTGRLFVDASGNVGVGVSPSAKLEVNGESRFTRSGASSQYVGIIADGTDTRIVAEGSSKNLLIKNNSTTSSAIFFDQAVASVYVFQQAGTERMRIRADGMFEVKGAGTAGSSPAFSVSGSAPANNFVIDSTGKLEVGTVGGNVTSGDLIVAPGSTTAAVTVGRLSSAASDNTTFNVRNRVGTSVFYVDTGNGRVGIGTTGPEALLTIGQLALSPFGGAPTYRGDVIFNQSGSATGLNANGGIEFKIDGTNNGYGARLLQAFNGVDGYNFALQTRHNSATWSTPLLVTRQGNVGIGATSPTSPLQVGNGAGLQQIFVSGAGADLLLGASGGNAFGFSSDTASLVAVATKTVPLVLGTIPAQPVVFGTSNFERARLDASGRLLVGTISARASYPNYTSSILLEGTNGSTSSATLIQNSDDSGGATLFLAKSRGTSAGGIARVSANDVLGQIVFNGADGTDIQNISALLKAEVEGTPTTDKIGGRLVFSTTADGAASPTPRMTIKSDGNVLIGTSAAAFAAGERISVVPNANTNAIGIAVGNYNNIGIGIYHGYTATGTAVAMQFQDHLSVVRGSITVTTSATAYNTSSDYRLKENVVPLTGAIDRVTQLQVHRFNFIADPDKTVDGFIAHEAQAVVPECVTGEKDAVDDEGKPVYQGIDQSKLVPLLTAALQEAIAEIESLKARVAALES